MNNTDQLTESQLTRPGALLGPKVHVKQLTGSTNDDAKALAEAGAENGTVVIAEAQAAGRGRLNRSWHSPGGVNLYFSIVLLDRFASLNPGLITLAAGAAVARAVNKLAGVPARIKWPNDVRVGSKKLCGILAEAGGRVESCFAVVGIGINVNVAATDLPPELSSIATSLKIETGREWDRAEIFHAALDEFGELLELGASGRRDEVMAAWRELAEAIGRAVRVETPAGTLTGSAVGVREDGALVVLADGEPFPIIAGDVHIIDEIECEGWVSP